MCAPLVGGCGRELGIGIVPYSPLGRGFFSGKVALETLEANDMRLVRVGGGGGVEKGWMLIKHKKAELTTNVFAELMESCAFVPCLFLSSTSIYIYLYLFLSFSLFFEGSSRGENGGRNSKPDGKKKKKKEQTICVPAVLQKNPRFHPDNHSKNQLLYDRVAKLAERHGCTPGQLALAWVQHQGADVIPIPGTHG